MTLRPSRLLAAVVLLLFSAAGVQAQDQAQDQTQPAAPPPAGGPLAGVNVLQISVAPLSADSQRCGLQQDLVLESFQQPLIAEGLSVQRSAHVRIVVTATTVVYEGGTCISTIGAMATQNTRYFDRQTQVERAGQVLMWSDSGLFVTGERDHVVLTNIGFRDLARSFVRKWQLDQ
ncbi:hypothetical protein [Pelagibius sp.]|uniref:hypothetical protein n=1 Tax=Pelagibius sp. TaxID=1931238 RepID=UPI0026040884|nr:hypothetical protein [Pelagibius sp.]